MGAESKDVGFMGIKNYGYRNGIQDSKERRPIISVGRVQSLIFHIAFPPGKTVLGDSANNSSITV